MEIRDSAQPSTHFADIWEKTEKNKIDNSTQKVHKNETKNIKLKINYTLRLRLSYDQ